MPKLYIDERCNIQGLENISDKLAKVKLKDTFTKKKVYFQVKRKDKENFWYLEGEEILEQDIPLYTGRIFVNRLDKVRQKRFNRLVKDYLYAICPDFKLLRKMIDIDMQITDIKTVNKKECTQIELWNPVVSEKDKYRILKGQMQSRKTWSIISCAFYYLLKYRMSSVIIVQNNLDASEQLVQRINDVFKDFYSHMKKQDFKREFKQLFKVINCERSKKIKHHEFRKAMNGETPCIYIVLRNASDIKNMTEITNYMYTKRYIVFIDESDFNDSGSTSNVQREIDTFKEHAGVIYDITATPMTSMMKEHVKVENIVTLKQPDGYKSILDIQCYDLTEEAVFSAYRESNPFNDKNLKKYIKNFSKTKPFTKQKHPRYSLVRISSCITPQLRVVSWACERYGEEVTIITYNGSGSGVTLRGKGLIEDCPLFIGEEGSKISNGVHTFEKGMHIGKIIAYLQENGGYKRFPRIMVFAGVLADRGISFGTANYGRCIKLGMYPWHLTEMYYIAAKGTSQANLLQATGRLCGVYPDDIPLSLYTNVGRDVYKAFGVQEELLNRSREFNTAKAIKKLIPRIHISEDKCTKRRITAPKIPCKLSKVSTDFFHGGLDWNVEGFMYDGKIARLFAERDEASKRLLTEEEKQTLREDIEVRRIKAKTELPKNREKEGDIPQKEYDRLRNKMFPLWSSSNTKIAKFMRKLDHKKLYTKEELKEVSGFRNINDLCNYTRNSGKGWGMIMIEYNGGYCLRPSLVREYVKNFGI